MQPCTAQAGRPRQLTRLCDAGLAAFNLPLAYIIREKFNQPIFACNNLAGSPCVHLPGISTWLSLHHNLVYKKKGLLCAAGQCWPAQPQGGPAGSLPPHSFAMYFKEGGRSHVIHRPGSCCQCCCQIRSGCSIVSQPAGVGTFLPLFYRLLEFWRQHQPQLSAAPQPSAPPSSLVATA